jgi:hypothetical protein
MPPAGAPAERPSFDIVSRPALPIAGVVLVGLVVAIAGNWPWGLAFYHVVGGGLWTGVDLFMGFVIGPIMRRVSVPARVELTTKLMPKMLVIQPTLVMMTLASGFQLARVNGMFDGGFGRHTWVVVSMGVVAVMAITALGLLQPANIAVLFELKKPKPNPEVIGRLMRRFVYAAAVIGTMQVATLIIMTRLAS